MIRSIKVVASLVVFGSLLFSTNVNGKVEAASDIDSEVRAVCGYTPEPGVDPDFSTKNCLLTNVALKYDVPPEIVKAVAEKESSGWKQFDKNGEAIVTSDNGIGIMQVTNHPQYKEDDLKNSIVYNITAGVEILDDMFERPDLPQINDMDRDVLEHWYFALMAYNGIKPVNSPVEKGSGERNVNAYQERVYDIIDEYHDIKTVDLPFTSEEFQYDPDSPENIDFVKKNYHFQLPLTKSMHSFTAGQQVKTTTAVNLRERPTTDSNKIGLPKGEVLTITGPFQYEAVRDKTNHFVWYPVKRSNGTTGYIASNYIKYQFNDVPAGHYAQDEIDYLVERGILKGVGGNKFGMGDPLTRWQAAVLLTRANNVSLGNYPDPNFSDVPKDHPYYDEIAAAVAKGMFKGMNEKTFEPDTTLTRAQMAVLLPRLYEFPATTSKHPFKDLTEEWYRNDVVKLYQAGITDGVSATEFKPGDPVTREQFAVFLVRAMDESFRLK